MIRVALPHPLLALPVMFVALVTWAVEPLAARADSAEEAGLNPSLPLFGPEGLILGSLWDLRH